MNIFRCYNLLGHNKEAIEDAANAANINGDNYAAREALAVAFYADGQFELALANFHRVFRSINISINRAAKSLKILRRCHRTLLEASHAGYYIKVINIKFTSSKVANTIVFCSPRLTQK